MSRSLIPPDGGRMTGSPVKCAGDPELLQEVSTLLDARAHMAGGHGCRVPLPSAQFGAYRAVHLLGRGGMSAVYLADGPTASSSKPSP